MDIGDGIIIFILFLLVLFIRNFLPKYMDEKGKNLATKEDIAEITRRTEEVHDEFRKEYEKYSSDLKFKYDFYYKQYVELYTKLYSIICQSEYIRHFFWLFRKEKFDEKEVPFLQIKKNITKVSLQNGITSIENSEEIEDDFSKKKIYELILSKGEFASQNLLKLAVAYKFAYDNSSGNEKTIGSELRELADEEELRLIAEIVMCIIREYNMLRKELRMEYSISEMKEGTFENINIESQE